MPFKTVLVKGLGKIKFPSHMSDDAIENSIKNLDMSEAARMARAKEQGFDTSKTYYHGTTNDFDEFDSSKYATNFTGDYGVGHYFSENPKYASKYAGYKKDDSGNVIPVKLGLKNPLIVKRAFADGDLWAMVPGAKTREELTEGIKKLGYDGIIINDGRGSNVFGHEVVVFDPKNIRSKHAAFNPDAKDSPSLLASSAPLALGAGLAAMGMSDESEANPLRSSVTGTIQGPKHKKLAKVSEFIDKHDDIIVDDLMGGITSWLDKVAYEDKITFKDRIMAALDLI